MKQGDSCPVAGSGVSPTPSPLELQHANVSQLGLEIFDLMNNNGATYSEDCLYLNVWTQPQSGEAKKAVMVWFYGGGFTTGSSTIAMYDGEYLAALEDVVVVSFKYVPRSIRR
jgi:cholinesterase